MSYAKQSLGNKGTHLRLRKIKFLQTLAIPLMHKHMLLATPMLQHSIVSVILV